MTTLPDEIFGPRGSDLKPLYGGNKKALEAIDMARYLVDNLEYQDGEILPVWEILEWLDKAKRELS